MKQRFGKSVLSICLAVLMTLGSFSNLASVALAAEAGQTTAEAEQTSSDAAELASDTGENSSEAEETGSGEESSAAVETVPETEAESPAQETEAPVTVETTTGAETLADESESETVTEGETEEETETETESESEVDDSKVSAYQPIDLSLEKVSSGALSRVSLPSSYSLLNYNAVTSVKDQGDYGTCWAFAWLAAAESNLALKGYGQYDLSELQFIYASYSNPSTSIKGLEGDYVTVSDYLNSGGNLMLAGFFSAAWRGLVQESLAPYSQASSSYKLPDDSYYNGNNVVQLKNAYWEDMSNNASVKTAIMNYGAAAASVYMNNQYYNSSTNSYYCRWGYTVDHAITIVGWDDNYSASNFTTNPGSNGAWLVKNSYGTGWGNNGYFWVSYKDESLLSGVACFADFDVTNNFQTNIYQYDGGAASETSYYNYFANVFTTSASELLTSVAIATGYIGVNYTIKIYTGVGSSPTSGTLVHTQTGYLTYAGYQTIDLNSAVSLSKGESFSVVVNLSYGGKSYGILVDKSTSYGWISTTSSAKAGQSFVSYYGDSWTDISKSNMNCRIKAFTNYTAQETVTVKFNANGGSVSTQSKTATVGGTYGTLPEPTRDWYDFQGWYTQTSGGAKVTSSTTVTSSSTHTLYARWKASDKTEAFVKRLYTSILQRSYDSDGLTYWTNCLKTGSKTAAEVSSEFVFSQEFALQNVGNETFVYRLYETYLNRTPDSGGLSYWLEFLNGGATRKWVVSQFVVSAEFSIICADYGISAGSISLTDYRDKNPYLAMYVTRLYSETLSRTPDTEGLEYWCERVLNKKQTAASVAESFIFSPEFTYRNLSDESYIRVLYKTFLDRAEDSEGMAYWKGQLSGGKSRRDIFTGFANSTEFQQLLARYGLS